MINSYFNTVLDDEELDVHAHEYEPEDELALVTMVDQETGEEFEFEIADEFDFDGEIYLVLLTTDEDPEAVFVRVVTQEDGTEALESLSDDEFDRVAEEYDRLCELEDEAYEDDEDDEDEE